MNKLKIGGFALMLMLAACSSQVQAPTTLTQADARSLSEAALGDLKLTSSLMADASTASMAAMSADSLVVNAQAWGLPRRLIMLLRAFEVYIPSAATGSCTITKSGDQTDADDDGVPVNATYAFDCTATGPNGATYTNQGSITLQDTNDAQAESGFSVSFGAFKSRISADAHHSKERTLSGSYTLDKQTSVYGIQKNYTHTVKIVNFNNEYSGSLSFKVSKTYTPDNLSKPWSAGTIEVKKEAPGSATWVRNNNTRTLSWYTDPTLHYNRAACQNPTRLLNFDSGAKEYVYTNPAGEQSTLRIEFSACGTYTVTFNKQAVSD